MANSLFVFSYVHLQYVFILMIHTYLSLNFEDQGPNCKPCFHSCVWAHHVNCNITFPPYGRQTI